MVTAIPTNTSRKLQIGNAVCLKKSQFVAQHLSRVIFKHFHLHNLDMTQLKNREIEKQTRTSERIVSSEPIKIVGVGGTGNQIVHRLMGRLGSHVGDVYVDADLDALEQYKNRPTIHLCLADAEISLPDEARAAAEAVHQQIRQALGGAQMVFIVSALGGVTGSGATAVVARTANQLGILTMCTVTFPHEDNLPFPAHQANNAANAEHGLAALRRMDGSLIKVRDNRRTVFEESEDQEPGTVFGKNHEYELERRYFESYEFLLRKINDDLRTFIADVVEMVVVGFHCADLEDLRYVMMRPGMSMLGVSEWQGQKRIKYAMQSAASSIGVRFKLKQASGVFLVVATSEEEFCIRDHKYALTMMRKMLTPEAHISHGYVHDQTLGPNLRITLLVTGGPDG